MEFVRRNTEFKYQNLIQLDFVKIKETLSRTDPASIE